MATVPVFNEAGLLSLLGDELYYDYFATEEGGDSNKGADGSSDATTGAEVCALESLVDSNKGADGSSDATTGAEVCALESLVDNILLEASLEFERTAKKPIIQDQVTSNTGPQATRFSTPKSSEDVAMAIASSVPKKTQADTKYCVELWKKWSNFRNSITEEQVPERIKAMDNEQLRYWLSRFVLEVRKRDGSEYPPNTLHHICCGLLRHIRQSGRPEVDFFKDPMFSNFTATLDSEMKRLRSLGFGSKKRQAEPLTEEEEELLWSTGQLGDHNPQALVDTMLYMNGIYFALRSGQEHRNLRFEPPQIELFELQGQRAYLRYTEDISKNNPGGLKGRKMKPKVVVQHENTANPSRSFVRLYKLYISKCPPKRPKDAFYLQPLRNPSRETWYSGRPLGHCKLDGTVARMCKNAGIEGFKTNHSLRVTTATRLFHAGIDEQLIMERTGHHSTDGIRACKRTSTEQQENLSDILLCSKKPKNGSCPSLSTSVDTESPVSSSSLVPSNSFLDTSKSTYLMHSQSQKKQMVENLQHMFNLTNCSGVCINVNIQ